MLSAVRDRKEGRWGKEVSRRKREKGGEGGKGRKGRKVYIIA